jgi:LDH2 family malate/lactate/ureidoglycolate dehydrogenase
LLPIGGPKVYGIALFIDIICGLLSGSSYGKDLKTFHKLLGPTGIGIMTMAVDIERFMSVDQFEGLLEAYVEEIKSSRKINGNDIIYMPGEIEADKEIENCQEGVELDDHILEQIQPLIKGKETKEISRM